MSKRLIVILLAVMIIFADMTSLNVKAGELSVNGGLSVLYYTVLPGDNLWSIARRTGTTVNNIKAANGLRFSALYVGQMLKITHWNPVRTVNYRVGVGETAWGLAQKYHTSTYAIITSNFMRVNYFMPGQIVTVPVNSTRIVKPVGISMLRRKRSMYYGDIYTWTNARRLFTVRTTAMMKDVATGITWNVRYYGGSNHADIEPITQTDTNKMRRAFGYRWSWTNKRPMVIYFTKAGVRYQLACSLIGMPHSTGSISGNGMAGVCCLYFYNSVGHSKPVIDPVSQSNIIRANGQ